MTASAPSLSAAQADHWITSARLAPFQEAAGADGRAAADLYVWNARLSSACLEVIHHVEVLVRNAIHRRLSLKAVVDAITRIRRLGRTVTRARVVAGLPLSFWTRLVGIGYDELWKSSLHLAFPHGSGTRRDAAGQLNRISQLRNDIAHHQPIIDIAVAERHEDMLALAAAVDPAAAARVGALSRVEETLAKRPGET